MTQHDVTSLTLLQRIKTGDDAAWRRLVFLYTPLLHHWCQREGVRGADAEDVVQEALDAVVRGIGGFQKERQGETFRGWLRGITRHKLLDHWRRRTRQPEARGGADGQDQLQAVTDPAADDDTADAEELHALFHRALELIRAEFEPNTWLAFCRVALESRTPAEAGAELGMSASAVRMAKSRVLRRFREELGDVMN